MSKKIVQERPDAEISLQMVVNLASFGVGALVAAAACFLASLGATGYLSAALGVVGFLLLFVCAGIWYVHYELLIALVLGESRVADDE